MTFLSSNLYELWLSVFFFSFLFFFFLVSTSSFLRCSVLCCYYILVIFLILLFFFLLPFDTFAFHNSYVVWHHCLVMLLLFFCSRWHSVVFVRVGNSAIRVKYPWGCSRPGAKLRRKSEIVFALGLQCGEFGVGARAINTFLCLNSYVSAAVRLLMRAAATLSFSKRKTTRNVASALMTKMLI